MANDSASHLTEQANSFVFSDTNEEGLLICIFQHAPSPETNPNLFSPLNFKLSTFFPGYT